MAAPDTAPLSVPRAKGSASCSFFMLAAALVALVPVAAYGRLGTVIVLVVAALAVWSPREAVTAISTWGRSRAGQFAAALLLWAAISLAWAPEPAVTTWLRVTAISVLAACAIYAVDRLSPSEARKLGQTGAAAGLAMLVLIAVEVYSRGFVLRIVHPEQITAAPEVWTIPIRETVAQATAVLAPLAFPFALLIFAATRRRFWAALYILAVLVVCASTVMDASWVAMGCGIVAFVVACRTPRFALTAMAGALIVYTATAPILSATVLTLDHIADLGRVPWRGIEQRVGIWHYVAGLIGQHPLLGHGFDAARALGKNAPLVPRTNWPALPLHPHNAVLQIWLELGGIGAMIAVCIIAAGAVALWPLTKCPQLLAVTLATIATTAVFALASFGLWQHWWLATWALAATVLALGLRLAPKAPLPL